MQAWAHVEYIYVRHVFFFLKEKCPPHDYTTPVLEHLKLKSILIFKVPSAKLWKLSPYHGLLYTTTNYLCNKPGPCMIKLANVAQSTTRKYLYYFSNILYISKYYFVCFIIGLSGEFIINQKINVSITKKWFVKRYDFNN